MQRFERQLTVAAGSIGLTLLLLSFDFHFLEANLYDLRVTHGFQRLPSPNIVLITLDDATTKEFDELAPLSLDLHTKFLEILESNFAPKAIGYLVDMNHVHQMNPELFQKEWGNRFFQAAERLNRRGTPFLLGTPFDITGEILPPLPLHSLPHAVAVVHKDGNVFSGDKITRRALLSLYDKPAFHLALAQKLDATSSLSFPPGSFYVPEVDGRFFFFPYHRSTVLNHRNPNDLAYSRYSFGDILNRRLDPGVLQDKIVLIGTLNTNDSSDYALTPYSKNSFTNPKLVVHANILDAILHQEGIRPIAAFWNWLITFVVIHFVLGWILSSTPVYGVSATLGLAFAFTLLSQFLFYAKGLWIRESQPLMGIFVGYYLAVPYRLIREYKTRWSYQRKNELLLQVEELKTNFLSLVTHDLKTPVARIQGLAEVLLRNSHVQLGSENQETLRHILVSTEELNHFISSTLELSKVESNRIPIKFESKDVNQLLEKSIQEFRVPAQAKNVQILCDLEPLFPVRLDSSLISKVFNNLIDNALKYSSPNSTIQVKSEEKDNWIIVSVKDQGIGMTLEEQQSLFTRFYRAKNDATLSVSGTGLGLYLTKYFIEVHQGRVEVHSEKNSGSTFRIFLPLDRPTPSQPLQEVFNV